MYEWFILIIFPSVLSLDYLHIKSDCCEKAENSLSMILTLLTVLILLVELNKKSKFGPEIFYIIIN